MQSLSLICFFIMALITSCTEPQEKWDQEKWDKNLNRDLMVDDILYHHLTPGMNYYDIVSLLNDPDDEDVFADDNPKNSTIYYDIIQGDVNFGASQEPGSYIRIELDENRNLIHCSYLFEER
jgi:hypothetical protein